jgi:hypothetical protein
MHISQSAKLKYIFIIFYYYIMSSKKEAAAAKAAELAREQAIFRDAGVDSKAPITYDLDNRVTAGMQLSDLLRSAKPNYEKATGKSANGGKRRKSRRIRTKKSKKRKSTFKKSTFKKSRAKRREK